MFERDVKKEHMQVSTYVRISPYTVTHLHMYVRMYVMLTFIHSMLLGYPMENGMIVYRRYVSTKQTRQLLVSINHFLHISWLAELVYT